MLRMENNMALSTSKRIRLGLVMKFAKCLRVPIDVNGLYWWKCWKNEANMVACSMGPKATADISDGSKTST